MKHSNAQFINKLLQVQVILKSKFELKKGPKRITEPVHEIELHLHKYYLTRFLVFIVVFGVNLPVNV